MHADFCVEALVEALARYGKPAIFNTDQGSQIAGALTGAGMKISLEGSRKLGKIMAFDEV